MPLAERDDRVAAGSRGSQDASAFIVSIHVPLAEHDLDLRSALWGKRVFTCVALAGRDIIKKNRHRFL